MEGANNMIELGVIDGRYLAKGTGNMVDEPVGYTTLAPCFNFFLAAGVQVLVYWQDYDIDFLGVNTHEWRRGNFFK